MNRPSHSILPGAAIYIGLLLVVYFSNPYPALAQKYDYQWVMGSGFSGLHASAYLSWEDTLKLTPLVTDFVTTGMTTITSNQAGNKVLFFSDGCRVVNQAGQMVIESDTLGPGWGYDNSQCSTNLGPAYRQSSIILPFGDSLFYLVYISRNREAILPSDPYSYIYGNKLLFAEIHQDEESSVSLKRKNVLIAEDTICPSDLTAIPKDGQPGYWLTCVREFTNKILVFSVETDTIFLHNSFPIAKTTTYSGAITGQSKFTPDGSGLLYFNMSQDIQYFKFDRSSGVLADPTFISFPDSSLLGGMSISPNSRFLYINTAKKLYQYDLKASNIDESIILIDTFIHNGDPYPGYFYSQELGPDCRIYINSKSSYKNLHVIHHPDLPGKDCGFELNGLRLPFYNQGTLTHFPYFRIDSELPLCDSTLALPIITSIHTPVSIELSCWPNPAQDELHINLLHELPARSSVQITDISGHSLNLPIQRQAGLTWAIDLKALAPGMYVGSIPVAEGRHYYWFRFLKL